jgi:acetoin utilization protein AcuA
MERNLALHVESHLTPDRFQKLIFASGFTKYEGYTSLYTRKEDLAYFVEKRGEIALALLDNQTIIGFAVLDYPEGNERWAKLGGKIVMVLKAVEVLREFRNQGIARQLLTHLFSDARLDAKIVYLTAYSWTWDFDYAGLDPLSYGNMLVSLYGGFGFKAQLTNDPNICLKSENIFMVRMGKNIVHGIQEKFKWLRFGVSI